MSARGSLNDPVVIDSESDQNDDVEIATKLPSDRKEVYKECFEGRISSNERNSMLLSNSEMTELRPEAKRRRQKAAAAPKEAKKQREDSSNKDGCQESPGYEIPIKLLMTEGPHHDSSSSHVRTHCRTMRQLLGLEQGVPEYLCNTTIRWIVIANYLIDFDYLLDSIPELVSVGTTVFFYGSGSDPSRWKQINPAATFVPLRPSDDCTSPTNPIGFKVPWGVHHTKMFLLGLSNGSLRVIIHTSNLRYGDLEHKAQGAYIQDFPLKENGSSLSSDFEKDLVSYLRTYKFNQPFADEKTLCDEIELYDFSSASVMLVASTPGRHKLNNPKGYIQLSNLIREHVPRRTQSKPIICQFSSIGSLSAKWLCEIAHKWDSADKSPGPKDLQQRLWLVYPTASEICDSVEGYRGGSSVPGNLKNTCKQFLKPLYHKWASSSSSSPQSPNPLHQPENVPHIKTYYQLNEDESGLEWFCLTSHNLSKAAWGEVIYTDAGRRIFTRHWELGVFISPNLLHLSDYKMVPARKACGKEIAVPLPYPLHPEKYHFTDTPWAVDKIYTNSDRWGRTSTTD